MAWLFLLYAAPVHARDPMAAEVLFNGGVEDMKAERYESGCPKIAESQRLEPRSGTLFTLAECWARAGRPATALARYHEYLRVFGRMSDAEQIAQRGRDQIVRQQIEKLSAEVPRLKIELTPSSPHGAEVKRNGIELGEPSLGLWLPVDPGEHVITASVAGGPVTTERIDLGPGESKAVVLSVRPPPPPPPVPLAPLTARAPSPLSQPRQRVDPGISNYKVAGFVFVGVAAVALAAGTVTGVLVLDKKPEIEAQCGLAGDAGACTPEGKAVADSAQALATASTVSFVSAAASGGLAITLFAVEPNGESVALAPRAGFAGRW